MSSEEIANEKRLRSFMNDYLPVFAYWHSEDRGLLAGFLADWRTRFPDLLPANEHNASGYWESYDLMAIHDEMLQAAGTSWQDDGVYSAAVAQSAVHWQVSRTYRQSA